MLQPTSITRIKKSSGILQDFDPMKIIKVLDWACENTFVDSYELFRMIKPHLVDGMTTREIQAAAIKVAADNITKETPDFQYVASSLAMFGLRKDVYDQFEPFSLATILERNITAGVYDSELAKTFTEAELAELDSHINHSRDFTMTYAGTMQLIEKYLVKNRVTGEVFETPQIAYMAMAMALHSIEEPGEARTKHIIDFYNAVSTKKISLPTPIMAGARTPTRQFSSCVVIESGDSLDSINESAGAIVKYISKRAGIGIAGGAIRAEGSSIGHGEIKHTGVIPFWKHFNSAVKSCSQGGIRGGAATMTYPVWHLEFENLIVLKNNKGVDENRIRQLDYSVQFNDLLLDRLVKNDYITLFSPDVADGELFKSFYSNPKRFKELYESLERDPTIRKKRIKAVDVMTTVMSERANTGRIYLMFIDNVNEHGPFERNHDAIKLSNLCQEICLPTTPVQSLKPGQDKADGEIALCTLSTLVLNNFDHNDQDTINALCSVVVRALDNLLTYQIYPVAQAEATHGRRSLGIGVTNYAAWLAKNFHAYTQAPETLKAVHELFERIQYGLINASVELAKEIGPGQYTHMTKYGQGLMPIDWYNKRIDELITHDYVCDWEELRQRLKKYGIRNSTLSAQPPTETSSQISNSTNGIEPPRAAVTTKQSKNGVFNQVVPEYEYLGGIYDFAWDMAKRGNKGYLTHVAIMQKFMDQSLSTNMYYDPRNYPMNKTPMSVMIEDVLFSNYYGIKTLYYHNTRDGADGSEEFVVGEADCDSCKV